MNKPIVVCLCGSTRFQDAWENAYREESLANKIVLSVGVMVHAGEEPIRDNSPTKAMLDELHLRKIDLADEVLILNVGGYIGESTARELAYARQQNKIIRFLEHPPADQTLKLLSDVRHQLWNVLQHPEFKDSPGVKRAYVDVTNFVLAMKS